MSSDFLDDILYFHSRPAKLVSECIIFIVMHVTFFSKNGYNFCGIIFVITLEALSLNAFSRFVTFYGVVTFFGEKWLQF